MSNRQLCLVPPINRKLCLKLCLVPPINRNWKALFGATHQSKLGQADRVLTKQAQWIQIGVAIRGIVAGYPVEQQSKRRTTASELTCCRDVFTVTRPASDFIAATLGCQIQTAHCTLASMPPLA